MRGAAFLAGAVAALALVAVPPAHAHPRCFGAAARDRAHPCHNRRLRLVVRPTPDRAAITPNPPCTPVTLTPTLGACAYGPPGGQPVALIGDSHAGHWRAAMQVVARHENWRVIELDLSRCPFSLAPTGYGEPASSQCLLWVQQILAWLGQTPWLQTVLVSANMHSSVVVPPGGDRHAIRVDGFLRAWAALPPSVTRLIVLRDTPTEHFYTHDCVRRALRAGRPPAGACKVSRRLARPPDAEADAAPLAPRHPPVIDLTSYFCDRRWCYPVVGGVLVHKDGDHMSALFARTLGPFLARDVDRLLRPRQPSRHPRTASGR
jgi:SGNH domain-containing protein